MATEIQLAFLQKAYTSACESGHIFPGAAAAEAAVEAAWGTSSLCIRANNLFGLKAPEGWTGPVTSIPTREYIKGRWTIQNASWPIFATWADAMAERMKILHRVGYYADALAATTPEQYVKAVSEHWSTDPTRAQQVLSVYHAHLDILDPAKKAA